MFKNNVIQIEINNQRWYLKNNKLKISVTTMLRIVDKGIGFQKWLGNADSYADAMKYAHTKANHGITIHDDIKTIFKGGDINKDGMDEWRLKRLKAFDKFREKYNPQPTIVEKPLYRNDIPYAGTVDYIGKITDEDKTINVIIDWKTGNCYKTHETQLACYKYLTDITIDELWLQRLTKYNTNYVYLPKPKKVDKIASKEILDSIYNTWYWFRNGEKKLKSAYRALNQGDYEVTETFKE